MAEDYEKDLSIAEALGILSQQEAEHLRGEALRHNRHPLQLLVERGVLSGETLDDILAKARSAVAALIPPALTCTESPAGHRAMGPQLQETLTPDAPTPTVNSSRETQRPPEPAFPVPGWERYQPVRFLGQGGMGRVYLAYDPVLRRNVALKFVRGAIPELLRRFIPEARAQARVSTSACARCTRWARCKASPSSPCSTWRAAAAGAARRSCP